MHCVFVQTNLLVTHDIKASCFLLIWHADLSFYVFSTVMKTLIIKTIKCNNLSRESKTGNIFILHLEILKLRMEKGNNMTKGQKTAENHQWVFSTICFLV